MLGEALTSPYTARMRRLMHLSTGRQKTAGNAAHASTAHAGHGTGSRRKARETRNAARRPERLFLAAFDLPLYYIVRTVERARNGTQSATARAWKRGTRCARDSTHGAPETRGRGTMEGGKAGPWDHGRRDRTR